MRKKTWTMFVAVFLVSLAMASYAPGTGAQAVTASLEGKITDSSGGAVGKSTITVTNTATGVSRTVQSNDNGDYILPALPAGDYTVTVEKAGFRKQPKSLTLQVGQSATLDFTLSPGQVTEKVEVEATSEVAEPTRTQVSTVITERQIVNLPVNGREFINFALLSPAVQIGDTTSGSTDVIVEPVTKLSFAGQNIHYNFIAVDGADDISTVSGIQRGTPPQDAVQEFRVINTNYSAEFGRAVGGIVNIITRGGTNNLHGSLYEFFRNNKLDQTSILQSGGLDTLRQNQFGGSLGGPIRKDRTFFFVNYEGQRRGESPFFNSAVLNNIAAINQVKTTVFGLPAEPANLKVLRVSDLDNGFARIDHQISQKHFLFGRYFVTDGRLTNQSPLNDGFDLPSAFKDNFFRDQSLVGSLTSNFTATLLNDLRVQYSRRSFDFPTVSTQPHLEVANTFTVGVNRGNPDFYRESRFEIVDNVTKIQGRHTITFGGNFNYVRSTESFPLFYPFEATFANLDAFLGTPAFKAATGASGPAPFVIFFERFQASSNFTEPSIDTSVFQGTRISSAVRNQVQSTVNHTYTGFFAQDKIRVNQNLTVNFGVRYEFETWPRKLLDIDGNNVDPRAGFAYNLGSRWKFVLRGGAGIFHGIIPAPLLLGQVCCGGTQGPFPGRELVENEQNAPARLFAFASGPDITSLALNALLKDGAYPDNKTDPLSNPFPACSPISKCGFFGDSVIVRFTRNHQNPYGIQTSFGIEFEPLPETSLSLSYLRVKGVHLGSFFNINQPDPNGCPVTAHDSQGNAGLKNDYHVVFAPPDCTTVSIFPGTRDPRFAVYFEADSRWNSVFDGLLLNVNKRLSHHFAYGISYTFSKSIDDGPNPSFVLIPQDTKNFPAERALSSDDVRHRFVVNATLASPTKGNILTRDFLFGLIATVQSPQRFTKFSGTDSNGDVFGVNDRVGIEGRNTFKGDNLRSVDMRLSRSFPIGEKVKAEIIAEAFNIFNTLNVRFFNTTYGADDFCPSNPTAGGCAGVTKFFKEGSPNPLFATPRAVFNPRQAQFALRFTF